MSDLEIRIADYIDHWLMDEDGRESWFPSEGRRRMIGRHLAPFVEAEIAAERARIVEWAKEIGHEQVMASVAVGRWLSAALDDAAVCDAMKADIRRWFSSGQPFAEQFLQSIGSGELERHATLQREPTRRADGA